MSRSTSSMAGQNIVEIEASPLDERTDRWSTTAPWSSIDGVRDKLRVLLVSGEPHSGERTWRNLLKSDASVDLVHFTILRPPEKQDGTPINELSLIAFPTRELFAAEDRRVRADHLRPLRPPGRAADRLFRQHRPLCPRPAAPCWSSAGPDYAVDRQPSATRRWRPGAAGRAGRRRPSSRSSRI